MIKLALVSISIVIITLVFFLQNKEIEINKEIKIITNESKPVLKKDSSISTKTEEKTPHKVNASMINLVVNRDEKYYPNRNKTSDTQFTAKERRELDEVLYYEFKETIPPHIIINTISKDNKPMTPNTGNIRLTQNDHQNIMKGIEWPKNQLTTKELEDFREMTKHLKPR
jgi:hypothetical protein